MTPLQLSLLLIVGAVVIGAVLLYAVIAAFVPAPKPDDDDRSLVERAAALRPPRTVFGRIDRDFEDTVRGTHWDMSTDRAIEIILLCGAIAGVITFLFTTNLFATILMVFLGCIAAFAVFLLFRSRRRRVLQEQLPDGCFQLARCLRSGLGLTGAVREASEFSPPPLGLVFKQTQSRLEMGAGAKLAFARTADDVRLTDFDLLAALIALHEEVGGNLPELLDRLAADIRARNQYRGFFRSTTALARATTFFVAAAAPVALLATLIFFPNLFANFLTTTLGLYLLIAAGVLWLLGVAWSLWLIRRHDEY
jgi:tight adherence protein B